MEAPSSVSEGQKRGGVSPRSILLISTLGHYCYLFLLSYLLKTSSIFVGIYNLCLISQQNMIVQFFLFLPTLSRTSIPFSIPVPVLVPVAIAVVVPNFGYMSISRLFETSTLNCPQCKCNSIFFLTDRTRKDLRQIKSDISETLKTLVSATKEEGQFPHTVARWKLSIPLK